MPVIPVVVSARAFALPVAVLILRVRVPPLSACVARRVEKCRRHAHISFSKMRGDKVDVEGVARMLERASGDRGDVR